MDAIKCVVTAVLCILLIGFLCWAVGAVVDAFRSPEEKAQIARERRLRSDCEDLVRGLKLELLWNGAEVGDPKPIRPKLAFFKYREPFRSGDQVLTEGKFEYFRPDEEWLQPFLAAEASEIGALMLVDRRWDMSGYYYYKSSGRPTGASKGRWKYRLAVLDPATKNPLHIIEEMGEEHNKESSRPGECFSDDACWGKVLLWVQTKLPGSAAGKSEDSKAAPKKPEH
jgi:hypothetical protein